MLHVKSFALSVILVLGVGLPALADCGSLPLSGRFLAYSIHPIIADGSLSLEVTVRFRLPAAKGTSLILPSEWHGQKDLYKAIQSLEALSTRTVIQEGESPWSRKVTFPLGQVVRLRYRVKKDWNGEINASSYFRVMLDHSYFHVSGRNFLVYPDLPDDESLPLSLEWKDLPPKWTAIDSFAGSGPCQSLTTRMIKLSNGLFAGGELRTTKLVVDGEPVYFATRGGWEFSDAEFAEIARRILSTEREFWGDTSIPNYLITLLASDDTPDNYVGIALEDSFALFMSNRRVLDFDTKFLLAHEIFHSWNAAKLGEIREETPYWFTEGFTDYYARALLLRAGLITDEEYDRSVTSLYQEYRLSRVLHVTGKQARERVLVDYDIQRLAYLRGDFLALRWDELIRQKSGGKQSLDTAMLDLFLDARRKELLLTDDFLAKHFGSYFGSDGAQDVQKYIEEGETIPLSK
jgi:predicted metalloprotease with PDZ domain